MNRKELYEMFGLDNSTGDTEIVDEDEAECIRLSFINNTSTDVLKNIISRYKASYNDECIRFFIDTISMIVNDSKTVIMASSVMSLLPLLTNAFEAEYFDAVDCFERLGEVEGIAQKVFVPMIYGLSFRCSQTEIMSDAGRYVAALGVLMGLPNVIQELRNEQYWGLGDSGLVYAKQIGVPMHFGVLSEHACFLDGFFEPFIYKKCEYGVPVQEYFGMQTKDVIEMSRKAYRALSEYSYKMYDVIFTAIRASPDVKHNFMRYISKVVYISKERSKTVFDWKVNISDGFAFNLCMLMSRFNKKIVDEKMIEKIDPECVEEISLTSFPTFCYFSKIHMMQVSYFKFGEYVKTLAYEYRTFEGEGGERVEAYRKGINSKISALNGLLFATDLFVDEKDFVEFIAEYTAEVEYPWPDFYYKTFLWMQEMMFEIVRSADISESLWKVMEGIMTWKSLAFKKDVVKILSHRSSSIKFKMINHIIDYYNSLERDETRMDVRCVIHTILKDGEVFSKMNICKRNVTFINCMMKDFENRLSEGLSSIKEIKEDSKALDEQIVELKNIKEKSVDEYENDEQIEALEERIRSLKKMIRFLTNKAKGCFMYVNGCFDLFMHILDERPDLFLVEEMIFNFVRVLNCNLKIITGPKCADLVIKSPEKYGFDAKSLLKRMVMVYIKTSSNKFIDAVANDRMYFDIGFFHTALEICESKYLIGEAQICELRDLVCKLEKVVVSSDIVELVPDEFIDPLTFNPIKNPVKLLTSRITVDRSTYDMLMMNGGIDPFNRMPLNDDMVVEDEEFKKRMNEYRRSKDL
ncbi:ubiquitin fusion degradation protein 2 [Ordospora colligata]|uniref:Ubiquitin fusion degradation protein 2 n=1 Tax=Ordospora colligata OC4 TaxID=1354746 RepID=A0A0B2UL15_9MICR|nr:ubiquitin fusion degradation protein 2 [Ordospora colligata OC4]KHN69969.1 ubiquitin fusion degradation protein 2 [Ordospora colligata OC4]TBU16139.1 ubiquitin fusion degradation protein 2 [Ordospora colligata]TBU16352.1 ubiquitin fusion degradation protein 2 [Ordospora colligata]TBU19056.1 ubiquitin fusion degradation protein 2 [Ordospora colligata]